MTASNATQSASTIRRAGAVCLVAALAGAASGVHLAAMDPDVSPDRFSYPQGAGEFTAIQVFFVVQHLGLLLGLLALAGSSAVPRTRLGRVGSYGAAAAMAALALMEVVAITARDVAVDSTTASVVGAGYGVVSFAQGVTLVAVGIAIARAGVWQGWPRWVVLAMGVWVFFPMFPALATMTDGARLAIAGWMLLFAVLGAALMLNSSPNHEHSEGGPIRRPKSSSIPGGLDEHHQHRDRHEPQTPARQEIPMKIRTVSIVLVAIASLLLAGCGSNGGTSSDQPTASPSKAASALEGTWRTEPVSPSDAEATLRKHGLKKWIKQFRDESPIQTDTALVLDVGDGWVLSGEAEGGAPEKIDYTTDYEVRDDEVEAMHDDGSNVYRWTVEGETLKLEWLRTTFPAHEGIPEEAYQRALYMTAEFKKDEG